MKKIIYMIIPSLFLLIGAGKAVQNINKNTNKQNSKILDSLKTELEDSKKTAEDTPSELEENYLAATEIALNQTVILQGGENISVETKTFKFNLPKSEYILLFKPNDEKFITTHDKKVNWNWTEISDKYFYQVSVQLDKEQNCLFITLSPIEKTQNKPFVAKTQKEQFLMQVSYADFALKKIDNAVFFDGQSLGMITYGFKKPIVYIE